METEPILSSANIYFCPLLRRGSRLAEVPPDAALLEPAKDIEPYLRRNFDKGRSEVELHGRIFHTEVWVPKAGGGFSYVAVDSDRNPIDRQPSINLDRADVQRFARFMNKTVAFGDFGLADDAVSIETQFIRPSFSRLSPEGEEQGDVQWSSVDNFARVVVIGGPGAGKTSCLRRITLEALERLNGGGDDLTVPVYFPLRGLRASTIDMATISRIISNFGAEVVASKSSALAESGQLLLLLDGLDEVDDGARLSVGRAIVQLAASYSRLRIVLSCRAASYEWDLPDFVHLKIKPFSPAQIREYSCHRLRSVNSARRFLSSAAALADVRDLVGNPLLLTLAADVYLRCSALPVRRTVLMEMFVESLIDGWDRSRGITRRRDEWASPKKKLSFLCELAYHSCLADRHVFGQDDIKSWTHAVLKGGVGDMLEMSKQHTGLLRETRLNGWSFSHRTIQEYLAARYVVSSLEDSLDVLQEGLKDNTWQEIWQYSCSLASNAKRLLDALIDNSSLSSQLKARLLSSALAENVEVDQPTASRCCAYIQDAIAIEVADFESSKAEVADQTILWSMELRIAKQNDNERRRLRNSGPLIQKIFNVRGSIWIEDLTKALKESSAPCVRRIGQTLSIDGTFRQRLLEEDNALLLELVQELPSMRDSKY